MEYHKSVLLKEAVEHLKVKNGGKYIDCTLGDGGHTLEILRNGGEVLAIDQDPEALKRAKERIGNAASYSNVTFANGNFKDIDELAKAKGFLEVDGILYDLGTSTLQLKDMERGFSFDSEAPLDMRMDPDLSVTAQDLVNALPENNLADLIFNYGGEHFARRIAKAIVKARKEKKIEKCNELSYIVDRAIPTKRGKIHKATKTFQALRIAVNNELENLDTSLSRAASLLIPGGRLIVISFHSLEDEISKRERPFLKEVTKKPLMASPEELAENPRARSAKMRVFEKI